MCICWWKYKIKITWKFFFSQSGRFGWNIEFNHHQHPYLKSIKSTLIHVHAHVYTEKNKMMQHSMSFFKGTFVRLCVSLLARLFVGPSICLTVCLNVYILLESKLKKENFAVFQNKFIQIWFLSCWKLPYSHYIYIYTFIAEDIHLIAFIQCNIEKKQMRYVAWCWLIQKWTQISQKMILI